MVLKALRLRHGRRRLQLDEKKDGTLMWDAAMQSASSDAACLLYTGVG